MGTGLGNYTISYVNGSLTVNPAALTITANSTSKTYGQTVTFAGTEFTDERPGQRRHGHQRDADEHRCGGDSDGGRLALCDRAQRRGGHGPGQLHDQLRQRQPDGNPAALTITADSTSKTYGDGDIRRH